VHVALGCVVKDVQTHGPSKELAHGVILANICFGYRFSILTGEAATKDDPKREKAYPTMAVRRAKGRECANTELPERLCVNRRPKAGQLPTIERVIHPFASPIAVNEAGVGQDLHVM
jgi:hypothetical protein